MKQRDINSPYAILGMICLLVMGPMFFLIMPLYVGALADHVGLDNQQIGALTSVELAGSAVSSLLALFWIRRFSWRLTAIAAGLGLIGFNLLSMAMASDYERLLLIRPLAGFTAGSLVCIAVTALGDSEKADRNFAFGVVGQLSLPGALMIVLPYLIADAGVDAVFGVFAVAALISIVGALMIPESGIVPAQDRDHTGVSWTPLWPLLGGTAFFIANTAVWAFADRIGVSSGLSSTYVGAVIGGSTVAAVLGAFAASWLSDRYNRFWPMLFAMMGEILCLALLANGINAATYMIAILFYSICWNLWLPFQMGVVASVDTTGRFAVLIPFFQSLGIAAGPALAAQFLTGDSYLPVPVIGVVFAVVSLVLFIPVTLKRNELAVQPAA
ncbi:MAG: MFS transporter [Pseudomonadales bacterium]